MTDDVTEPGQDEPGGGQELDAGIDAEAHRRIVGTADVIAGLMTMGLLDHAGGIDGLHEALFPSLPPGRERDRAMFLAGAVTGAAVGRRKGRAHWDPAGLDDVAEQLYAVGWERMGALAKDAAEVAPAWWERWGQAGTVPGSTPAAGGDG